MANKPHFSKNWTREDQKTYHAQWYQRNKNKQQTVKKTSERDEAMKDIANDIRDPLNYEDEEQEMEQFNYNNQKAIDEWTEEDDSTIAKGLGAIRKWLHTPISETFKK